MKIVIFGLSVSSSWGNGHAVLWRGLIRALGQAGHAIVFCERDVPYYAAHRDLTELPNPGHLLLYPDWTVATPRIRAELAGADIAIVTSYCPDGRAATDLVADSNVSLRCFYDLDTPVTLARMAAGEDVPYLGPDRLTPFDLVLSYTGGAALTELRTRLGARRTMPLYGSVDPDLHRPASPRPKYASLLSYLGTYAEDRQSKLQALLIDPARQVPNARFIVAGAQYPENFPWPANIAFLDHLPPAEHAAFYASSRLTLNITRRTMARMGWCPSGRLFEAASCGATILSDWFDGLDEFFTPGAEIIVARTTQEALAALRRDPADLARIGSRARQRALDEHTATRRASQMIDAFHAAASELV